MKFQQLFRSYDDVEGNTGDDRFGGLVRVSPKGRGFLWVHPVFVSEY